ncbi:MAG: ArsR family transcriptional regulator [Azoarcus sp.]|jgi:hypothetical protein|nr:ArsR family transcriptional regulator [Azoarcus sp.]
MSFHDFIRSDRRLVILRILKEMPACRSNSSVIDGMLDRFGHNVSRDVVCGDLRWLAEQGLIDIDEAGPVLVATLTGRGLDVATGQSVVDGVSKPRPAG